MWTVEGVCNVYSVVVLCVKCSVCCMEYGVWHVCMLGTEHGNVSHLYIYVGLRP